MANFNKVLLLGNLTRDPELKYLSSGTAVCEIGLAVNRRWTDKAGEKHEDVTFVDCKAMGRPAEVLSQYMEKGRQLFVEGRLDFRSWEARDGSKRSKLEVFIESFQFLGGGRGRGGGGSSRGGADRGGSAPASQPHAGYEQGYDDDVPF